MNERNTCENCRYSLLIRGFLSNKVECRRYPPQLVMVGQESLGLGSYKWKPAWPQLAVDEFCGEFVLSAEINKKSVYKVESETHFDSPKIYKEEPSVQEYRGVRLNYMKITGKYMVEEKLFSDKDAAMKFIDETLG